MQKGFAATTVATTLAFALPAYAAESNHYAYFDNVQTTKVAVDTTIPYGVDSNMGVSTSPAPRNSWHLTAAPDLNYKIQVGIKEGVEPPPLYYYWRDLFCSWHDSGGTYRYHRLGTPEAEGNWMYLEISSIGSGYWRCKIASYHTGAVWSKDTTYVGQDGVYYANAGTGTIGSGYTAPAARTDLHLFEYADAYSTISGWNYWITAYPHTSQHWNYHDGIQNVFTTGRISGDLSMYQDGYCRTVRTYSL